MPIDNPGEGIPELVLKTVDEVVNNSDVLQNDDALWFAVGVNETVDFRLFLLFRGPTQNLNTDFTIPVASTLRRQQIWGGAGTVLVDATGAIQLTGDNQVRYYQAIYLYQGGVNGGLVRFRWAQAVAAAENAEIFDNSFMVLHRLPS